MLISSIPGRKANMRSSLCISGWNSEFASWWTSQNYRRYCSYLQVCHECTLYK